MILNGVRIEPERRKWKSNDIPTQLWNIFINKEERTDFHPKKSGKNNWEKHRKKRTNFLASSVSSTIYWSNPFTKACASLLSTGSLRHSSSTVWTELLAESLVALAYTRRRSVESGRLQGRLKTTAYFSLRKVPFLAALFLVLIKNSIFNQLQQILFDVSVNGQSTCVDDGHVHTSGDGVV